MLFSAIGTAISAKNTFAAALLIGALASFSLPGIAATERDAVSIDSQSVHGVTIVQQIKDFANTFFKSSKVEPPAVEKVSSSSGPTLKSPLNGLPSDLLKIIDDNPNKKDVAKNLAQHDSFLGLVAVNESFMPHPYYDGKNRTDLNVGFGYNITKHIGETDAKKGKGEGIKQVIADLSAAGIDQARIDILLKGKKKDILKVDISASEAVRLVAQVRSSYESIARETIGSEQFDKLSLNKQEALTYFAYNVGPNMKTYKSLIRAIHNGNDQKTIGLMTPTYKIGKSDGTVESCLNHRLRAWVASLWIDKAELVKGIEDPATHEGKFASVEGLTKQISIIHKTHSSEGHTMVAKADFGEKLAMARGTHKGKDHYLELPSKKRKASH